MKTFVQLFCVLCISILFFQSAVRAAGTNPPPRLTVELRDGSRVVGASTEKNFKFKSALLGEIKLNVKDIRSVECVSSNSAKLTTANGDLLTVSFVDSEFAVKTSFGKVNLGVNSVRKFSVAAGGTSAHPLGLVALWSGEGNGNDSIGGNNATLTDVSFAEGKVGQAFVLNGFNSQIRIPASPSLNVGLGDGLTIEMWINPANLNLQDICEWNSGTGRIGVNMGISASGVGAVNGNIVDTSGMEHNVISPNNLIVPNSFQHIALTYDKTSGVAAFYWNGSLAASTNIGIITPQTSFNFFMGNRPSGAFTGIYFQGKMDEPAIYNRALTAEEIRANLFGTKIMTGFKVTPRL